MYTAPQPRVLLIGPFLLLSVAFFCRETYKQGQEWRGTKSISLEVVQYKEYHYDDNRVYTTPACNLKYTYSVNGTIYNATRYSIVDPYTVKRIPMRICSKFQPGNHQDSYDLWYHSKHPELAALDRSLDEFYDRLFALASNVIFILLFSVLFMCCGVPYYVIPLLYYIGMTTFYFLIFTFQLFQHMFDPSDNLGTLLISVVLFFVPSYVVIFFAFSRNIANPPPEEYLLTSSV